MCISVVERQAASKCPVANISFFSAPPVRADAGEHSGSGSKKAGPPTQRGWARSVQDSRVAQHA